MVRFVYPNRKKEYIMSDPINLQEAILSEVCRDKVPVTLFLMNGFQMRGTVTAYDGFTVFLQSEGKQQMIYKHAISTIVPVHTVTLSEE